MDDGEGRGQRQQQHADGHEGDGQHHGGFTSRMIGEGTDHQAAQRARDESNPEGRDRDQEADNGIMVGKKLFPISTAKNV
jgi:hypothetical protein